MCSNAGCRESELQVKLSKGVLLWISGHNDTKPARYSLCHVRVIVNPFILFFFDGDNDLYKHCYSLVCSVVYFTVIKGRDKQSKPTMSDAARLKSTIYVGGLDQAVTARTLNEAFIPFGEVADISLPKPEVPSSTDLHRGFGYVEFELAGDAAEAIDNMDQSELYGRIIKVAAAKPQKDSNEGLGSKTAIWEQVSSVCFWFRRKDCHADATFSSRRVTYPNTPSARRIGLLQNKPKTRRTIDQRIQCKG